MRVLSLGAGVQSTTLLLMAHHGEIAPFDAVIFADTQWERSATYENIERLILECGDDVPFYRVTAGNIREEALTRSGRIASMPAFVLRDGGGSGQLPRQCTRDYKIRVIRRKVRELGATAANPVEMAIGISWDEPGRLHDSDVRYIRNIYPLIDLRMTRQDCARWLVEHGYPVPPKSACVGCPFRSDREWRNLTPAERADANAFDAQARDAFKARSTSLKGSIYLHKSLIPLALVDTRNEQDRGQTEMFGEDECGGWCGL